MSMLTALRKFFIGEPPSQEIKERAQRKRREAQEQLNRSGRGTGRLITQGLIAIVGGGALANPALAALKGLYPSMDLLVGTLLYVLLFVLFAFGIWMLLDIFFGKPAP